MLQMRLLLPFLLHLATLEVSGGDAGGVAQRCMKKVVMLEEVVFDERTECHHVMQESCFQVHQPDFKKQEVGSITLIQMYCTRSPPLWSASKLRPPGEEMW